jgi:predicted alpha/beta superfamily hydrolase
MAPPTTRKLKLNKAPGVPVSVPIPSGNLWLHELKSQIFGNTRLLRVWLPPDYDGWGEALYPVLYLNDGQNLFDPATAFAGVHWQAGETAARLIADHRRHRQHQEPGLRVHSLQVERSETAAANGNPLSGISAT